jgi:sortase A
VSARHRTWTALCVAALATSVAATGCGSKIDDTAEAADGSRLTAVTVAEPMAPPVPVTAPPAPPPAPVVAPAPAGVMTKLPAEVSRAAAPAPAPPKQVLRQPGGLLNRGGDSHKMVPANEIGTVEIPKLGIVHPLVEGIGLEQLHWAPGHWPGTAMPGQVGNTVFAGHRVTHTRPFLDIDLLVPGDQIIFRMPNGTFTYEITGSQVVSPRDVHIVDPTPDATVTLFACHPKHSARQRYVVRGRLIG